MPKRKEGKPNLSTDKARKMLERIRIGKETKRINFIYFVWRAIQRKGYINVSRGDTFVNYFHCDPSKTGCLPSIDWKQSLKTSGRKFRKKCCGLDVYVFKKGEFANFLTSQEVTVACDELTNCGYVLIPDLFDDWRKFTPS